MRWGGGAARTSQVHGGRLRGLVAEQGHPEHLDQGQGRVCRENEKSFIYSLGIDGFRKQLA